MEFYIDIDKSAPNWIYSLRLRKYPEEKIGIQVAKFNPYVLTRNPGIAEKIVQALNKELCSGT